MGSVLSQDSRIRPGPGTRYSSSNPKFRTVSHRVLSTDQPDVKEEVNGMADVLLRYRIPWRILCIVLLLGLSLLTVRQVEARTVNQSQGITQHVVTTGDAMLAIATRYGTTVEAIQALNNLDNPNLIYVGQVLRIPAPSPATETPATANQGTSCASNHVVSAGEGLLAIASHYGVSVSAIANANGIANINLLQIGQVLCIPAAGTTSQPIAAPPSQALTYTVKGGDNLFRIALTHGVSVDALIRANGITSPNLLSVGQVLTIPAGGTTPQPAPAPAPPVAPPTNIPDASANAFTATFYNNMELQGTPVLTQVSAAPLSHDWGLGSPGTGVNADGFSARFQGDFTFTEGTYRFTVIVDDGMQLFVDDRLVKAAWQDQAATTYFADVALSAGVHRVRVEYYDRARQASLALRWQSVSAAAAPPPAAPPPAAPPAAPSTATLDFAYGIQAHALGSHNAQPVLRHVNDLGFTWVKQQVRWEHMEPSQGNRQWGELDDLVQRAGHSNVNLLFSVVAAPGWAREAGAVEHGPPVNNNTFASYIGDLAGRYCGTSLKAIEVWNEQNLHYEWGNRPLVAADYVALLSVASAAIKQACPSMFVISGALTPAGNNGNLAVDDFTYLRQMLAAGMAGHVDAIGAHPSGYNVPPHVTWQEACQTIQTTGNSFNGACDTPHHSWSFRSTMEGYHQIAVAAGAGHLKIVPTEFGWAAGGRYHDAYGYADDNSFQEQAAWTVEAYRMMSNWSWAGPAFLWNLNFRVVADRTERAQWGIVRADWSPLPVYDALKAIPK